MDYYKIGSLLENVYGMNYDTNKLIFDFSNDIKLNIVEQNIKDFHYIFKVNCKISKCHLCFLRDNKCSHYNNHFFLYCKYCNKLYYNKKFNFHINSKNHKKNIKKNINLDYDNTVINRNILYNLIFDKYNKLYNYSIEIKNIKWNKYNPKNNILFGNALMLKSP